MKRILTLFAFLLLAGSCGKKNNSKDIDGDAPAAAQLLLPAQDAVCNTGTIVSDSVSLVSFSWKLSANTDSYIVNIKNLFTGQVITAGTSQQSASVLLKRNTPWSWYITSKSNTTATTSQSATWKFYNAGAGITTYAPYPADLVAPTPNTVINTTTVNLSWKGAAVDTTSILNYDVYFGTTTNPAEYKTAVTTNFLNNISISPQTTYHWSITTRDKSGNTTTSEVSSFSTN